MEKKTFEDFKQEVADRYGYNDWFGLINHESTELVEQYANETLELWGQYCREEGKKEVSLIVERLAKWSIKYPRNRIYSARNIKMDDELIEIEELAKDFLSGLKQTNSNNK